ncbi:MAG: tRNA (N(6)-L-threonylcarbamoyladenosine(37)-C(2))-methylthiotransferase MtaB [Clostridiales bacterium]|nr:tRNA (N(6)-L-threonylcarbamoyladenosine(37)-C(2))-methylthiotransferase MtaB [Clostridiales bacterium]
MKVAFYTLGCKVNQYESQAMAELFLRRGYQVASPEEGADVYIINSCTVTAAGDKKTRQAVRRFRRQSPGSVVVLTGCLPQTDPQAAETLPEADVVLGNRDRAGVVDRVEQFLRERERIVSVPAHCSGEAFEELDALGEEGRTRAFLKIQDGCTQFCAYCIIPYARGPLRSRPLEDLRREVRQLAAAGYREVVLTGINLSLYGREQGCRLPDAVEAAASVSGIRRVRIGSLEPELLTDEDIARLAAVEKLCGQFHLSLQSGCDATLARMNRHYTTARYREIAAKLRAAFPGCAITTDVITGFPGETEAEFQETLAFVEGMAFAAVHIFPYSQRRGTAAAGMEAQVPMEERRSRAARLARVTEAAAARFRREQVGSVQRALIECKQHPDYIQGYTENYTPVRILSTEDRRGEILTVQLIDAGTERCLGVEIESPETGGF